MGSTESSTKKTVCIYSIFVSLNPAYAPAPETLRPALETLHPALWRAHQLGRSVETVLPSGFDALDAQLPGGGWPCRALTELLLAHPGVGEMRLLAPALARVSAPSQRPGEDVGERSVMLFDPPARPCAQALTQLGVDARQIVVVHGREGPRGSALRHLLPSADLLWALEQALRSAQIGAALAWLPERLGADALRRLQLAAQAHDGPVFLLRGIAARLKPSPAPLRLALHASPVPDEIVLHLLKRRGPPLAQALRLVLPSVLSAPSKARALERLVAAMPRPVAAARPSGQGRVTQGAQRGQDATSATPAAREPRWRVDPARLGTG
jgi:protein ImuA